MCKVNFECYEDNAGGLYLFIMDGNQPIEMFMNYEYFEKGSLKEAIDNIDCYRDWDNAVSQKIADGEVDFTIEYAYEGLQDPECDLIADNDGIYLDRCGSGAEDALGMTREV